MITKRGYLYITKLLIQLILFFGLINCVHIVCNDDHNIYFIIISYALKTYIIITVDLVIEKIYEHILKKMNDETD